MEKKVLLVGNFGSGNLGDELILYLALKKYPDAAVMTTDPEFSQGFCEKNFTFAYFPPTGIKSFFRFFYSRRYRKSFLGLRNEVKAVLFPGGGLFAIKFRACFLWFLTFLWLKLIFWGKNVPIGFEYQGVDENLGFVSRNLAKFVFKRSYSVSVRDEASGRACEKMGIKNYEIAKDRLLESQEMFSRNPEQERISRILINIISQIDDDSWINMKPRFTGKEVIFVPFHPGDEYFLPEDFKSIGKVFHPQTATELIDLFRPAELYIGARLHFLILSLILAGDPERIRLLGKAYSEKVKNFCENANIRNY